MSRLEFFERVKLAGDRDVALARAATGRAMDAIGAKAVRRTRFVTAVSEIARNAVVHGGGGEIDVMIEKDPPRVYIECRDNGPGIRRSQSRPQRRLHQRRRDGARPWRRKVALPTRSRSSPRPDEA